MAEPAPVTSWIVEADETCEHCGQTYAVELEVRCVECDGPLCPFCVAYARGAARCPSCGEADGEGD